jgi:hypothetical protein
MNARQLEKLGAFPGSMAEQSEQSEQSDMVDMVDMVARFDPKIVKMCGDGSKAED